MTDTLRLNAIEELGLTVTPQDHMTVNGPVRAWLCQYNGRVAIGATAREAIDLVILDLDAECFLRQH